MCIRDRHFGSVPVIFAKKTRSRNLDGALYTAKVHSFTKDITYDVQLSKKFLGPQDTVPVSYTHLDVYKRQGWWA